VSERANYCPTCGALSPEQGGCPECGAPCPDEWHGEYREGAVAERHRKALVRIADAESGHWGTIAHEALHPKQSRPKEEK
jgi:hypothetical protein